MLEYPDLTTSEDKELSWACEGQIFNYDKEFKLESGEHLPGFRLSYSTYGHFDPDTSHVVWVCHALTGNANVLDWWHELFGAGKLFEPHQYFIICANVIGSCYGSTGPLDINPATSAHYFHDFPQVTAKDVIASFELLREHIGILKIHTCIGGSLGGQHALEWAVSAPNLIQNLVLMATNARTSPWGIALNETQRMAIRNDKTWVEKTPLAGVEGMKVARAIALLSYRSYQTYDETQKDDINTLTQYKAVTYQQYQGEKFGKRFDAFSYWALTVLLDSHNVGRNRASVEAALGTITAKTLIIGISSDVLFPPVEQEYMSQHIPGASLHIIESLYGHDGFLIETEKISSIIRNFYNS